MCNEMIRFVLVGFGAFFILSQAAFGVPPSTQPTAKKSTAKHRPTSHPALKKRPTTKRAQVKRYVCPEERRFGRYCLGRVIGGEVRVKRLRCPHDGEVMDVLVIKGMRASARDSDLRPHLGRFGQRDYIWICPRSNYAALAKDFHASYDRLVMERALQSIRRPFRSGEEIPGTFRYRAAAAAYVARQKDARFFGEFYLRALWAAREEKNLSEAVQFRRKSIAAMQFALKQKLYPLAKRPTVAYLVGELYRQDGKFFRAALWFERAWNFISVAEKKNSRKKGTGLRNLILMGRRKAAKRDTRIFVIPSFGRVPDIKPKKKK